MASGTSDQSEATDIGGWHILGSSSASIRQGDTGHGGIEGASRWGGRLVYAPTHRVTRTCGRSSIMSMTRIGDGMVMQLHEFIATGCASDGTINSTNGAGDSAGGLGQRKP